MTRRRLSVWDIGLIVAMIAAVPAMISDLMDGAFGLFIIGLLAIAVGVIIIAGGWIGPEATAPETGEPDVGRASGQQRRRQPRAELVRDSAGRHERWASAAVISGVSATGVMTIAIIAGYLAALSLGSGAAGASTLQHWLNALADNTVAGAAQSNLSLSVLLHFLAGIAWALIYAAFFEPRLSGPTWRKGLLFSLLPWLLSVAVFFPLTGAGFFGVDLHAGPLPAIGNLILHLIYGFTLSEVYAAAGVLVEDGQPVDSAELTTLAHTERLMALGIVPGLVVGAIIGLIGASVLAPGTSQWLVVAVGAVLGALMGILLGSLEGLSPAAADTKPRRLSH